MSDLSTLSAAEILATPLDMPENLFGGDAAAFKSSYRKLLSRWHPDHCKAAEAADVLAHIVLLKDRGEDKIGRGTWSAPNTLKLKAKNGKIYTLRYLKRHDFELGRMFISENYVTYLIDPQYADLAVAAKRNIEGITYPDDKLRAEFSRTMPSLKASFETDDASVLVVNKDKDLVLLRDALTHEGGKLTPGHTAWIMRRLHNLTCFLTVNGIAHNDLSPDTYFISPEHHYGALLGGWWYATPNGAPLTALPTRTISLAPSDVIREKKADARVDLELIRAIGRELLGDPGGSALIGDKTVPRAFSNWLRMPGSGDAMKDYRAFDDDVLPKSFGPRRFVKWDVKPTDIYKPRS